MPLLSGYKQLKQEAKDLGVVLTTEQANSAAELSSAFTRVTATVKSVTYSIGGALAPTITDLANRAASIISTIKKWVDQNQALILTVAKGIAIIGALGAGLIALGSTISLIGVGVGGLAAGLGMLASIVGAVLSPVGLLVAGLAAGSYAFLTMTDAGNSVIDFFKGEFQNLYNIVKSILDGLVTPFRLSDFAGVASIAFAAVKVATLSLWSYLKPLWDTGVYYLSSIWDSIAFSAMEVWTILKTGLSWSFLYKGLLSVLKYVQSAFLTGVGAIADGFAWLINKAI